MELKVERAVRGCLALAVLAATNAVSSQRVIAAENGLVQTNTITDVAVMRAVGPTAG
jgi:hypothetical protein